ncbi:MAG: hypothetical protein JWP87_5492 [Labilithrix sp.]|nr:hypothetical protein [Labilithrix sp.]
MKPLAWSAAALASCAIALFSASLVTSCSSGVAAADAEGGLADGGVVDGDSGDAGPMIVPCAEPAPHACEPTVIVTDSASVLERIRALDEATDSPVHSSSGFALRPTVSVRTNGNLDLDVTVFRQMRPACPADSTDAGTSRPSCTESVFGPERPFHTTFSGTTPSLAYPDGVECVMQGKSGCEKLRLGANTTVRFQRVVETNAFANVAKHVIRVVRECTKACAPGEVFCEASKTCLVDGNDSCLLCDGKPASTCACSAACGTSLEGKTCAYETSDDTENGGSCATGECR